MGRELELKYSTPAARAPALPELEAGLSGLGLDVRPAGTHLQRDVYFDDPDLTLERHALALRVRTSGERRVAAVKARGDAMAGLFEREELEAPLHADPSQDPGAWPALVAERLAGLVDLRSLASRLEIVTTRETFELSRAGRPVAELSFDAVVCRPPAWATQENPTEALFSEVEVEAVGATGAAELRAIGSALEGLMPLVAGSASKLERAVSLLAPFV